MFGGFTATIQSNDGTLFKKNCGLCHTATVNGSYVGRGNMDVDLTGVVSERGEDYVRLYIRDPEAARTKYPEIYKSIKEKYPMIMPPVELSDREMQELIEMLK